MQENDPPCHTYNIAILREMIFFSRYPNVAGIALSTVTAEIGITLDGQVLLSAMSRS